jgi:Spy/CpxP family protein refolding chaperone
MSQTSRMVPLLAAAAAALCLTSVAFAQDHPSSPPMGDAPRHDGDRAEWRKVRQERRARYLHDILNIRSDQESAFQAFLADTRPRPHDHGTWAERNDGAAAPMTTPERLDRRAAVMAKRTAERQAAFQRRAEATKRFYATLGPEQQRAFDALHAMHGMRGHEGGSDRRPGWGGQHERGDPGLVG